MNDAQLESTLASLDLRDGDVIIFHMPLTDDNLGRMQSSLAALRQSGLVVAAIPMTAPGGLTLELVPRGAMIEAGWQPGGALTIPAPAVPSEQEVVRWRQFLALAGGAYRITSAHRGSVEVTTPGRRPEVWGLGHCLADAVRRAVERGQTP